MDEEDLKLKFALIQDLFSTQMEVFDVASTAWCGWLMAAGELTTELSGIRKYEVVKMRRKKKNSRYWSYSSF